VFTKPGEAKNDVLFAHRDVLSASL
jgi:hypothetical protein